MTEASAPTHAESDEPESGEKSHLGPSVRSPGDSRPALRALRLAPSDRLVVPLVFVSGCLVETLRSSSTVLHPGLWAEDGTVWFQVAYNQGWLSALVHPQVGYLQTLSGLVADVGLLIPLRLVPALFMAVGLVVQVLPAVLVASRRYATAIPDFRVRLVFAGLYLLVPNSSEVNINLTDAQWHLGLLAVLVILAGPATGIWRAFDVMVMVLSGLTGPFILSVIIVALILYYSRRQRYTLVLATIAVATGVAQIAAYAISPRAITGALGATMPRFIDVVGGRLIANTVFGTATTTSPIFTSHMLAFSTATLVVALVLVGAAVWRGPLELKLFNLFGFLELAAALWSPLVVPHTAQWPALAADSGARYWAFPSLALLVDVVWLIGRWGAGRRVLPGAAALVIVAVAVFGIREDFRYPEVPSPGWEAQVQRFERLAPHRSFVFHIRPHGWTMTLTKK